MDVNGQNDPPPVRLAATQNRLLIVDDDPRVIKSIVRSIKQPDLEILTAQSGAQGIEIIKQNDVGVVISDQNMPNMDGIRFLEKVRDYDKNIVRLMLTGDARLDGAIDAIRRSQIFEYLTKPWELDLLQNALQRAFKHYHLTKENHQLQLLTKEQNIQLRQWNDDLEKQVKERTIQLVQAVREGVLMLSYAAEARDDNTGDHVKRIQDLTKTVCLKIGMAEPDADRIGFFSMMHDVGKIHIPDRILNKPGPLTPNEWQIMKQHTIAGEQILGNSSYYAVARQIARSHHEWIDGNGYPDGLKGDKIPLPARIVAVVDVYDALTHDRPYKKAWPRQKAIEELKDLAGRHLDKEIVSAFVEIASENFLKGMER